jgi:curli biogenesis system outer membrane secretion channel CsgG
MHSLRYLLLFTTFLLSTRAAEAGRGENRARTARMACLSGDYAKGVSILSALFVETNDSTHIYNQARCFEQNRRYEDAIARFQEYLRAAKKLSKIDSAEAEKHIADCQGLLAAQPNPASGSQPPSAMQLPVLQQAPLRAGGTANVATGRPVTVAVLYFDYDGKVADLEVLRKGLAQMLISDLAGQEGCQVVERDRLEAVLAEQKLGQSGKLDKGTAAKVGKLLGARYIVVGGYFDLMGALRIDARLVSVETGEILGSTGSAGKPGDFLAVEQKIGQEMGRLLADRAVGQASAGQPAAPASTSRILARPKAPAQLKTHTAVAYSQALAMLDKGDRERAKTKLQEVVKEQPDFMLASLDLNRLMQ